MVACKMLMRSIVSRSTTPTPTPTDESETSSEKAASRASSVSTLLSPIPGIRSASAAKTTAAATTGPANGPRPASSTPATCVHLNWMRCRLSMPKSISRLRELRKTACGTPRRQCSAESRVKYVRDRIVAARVQLQTEIQPSQRRT
eukprot:6185410-Pleurochrysis_carterae.AAC.4